MNNVIIAVLALVSALVGGGGVWAYLASRRASSGSVATSNADTVFAAMNTYQMRMDADMKTLRDAMVKLDADYAVERRGRMECEARITVLESTDTAAVIIEKAKKEAATIRFDAAKAAELLKLAADKAAAGLVDEAATAKQVVDDARDK